MFTINKISFGSYKKEVYLSLTFQFAVESWGLGVQKHHINGKTGAGSAENLLHVAVLAAEPTQTYIMQEYLWSKREYFKRLLGKAAHAV